MSTVEAKDFSYSLCVQTSLLSNGYCGSLQGVTRGRGVTLTTHPYLVPRSRMSRRTLIKILKRKEYLREIRVDGRYK
jgi:hypothetical protein